MADLATLPAGRRGVTIWQVGEGRLSPGAARGMSRTEEAASAVQRALLACMGPGAAEQIALAQARLAWQEAVSAAGLERGGLTSPPDRASRRHRAGGGLRADPGAGARPARRGAASGREPAHGWTPGGDDRPDPA